MSDCFDHESDAWDSRIDGLDSEEPYISSYYNYYHNSASHKKKSKKVKCKLCGKKKLHWTKTENGWRLKTKKGKIHSCLPAFKCSMNKH